RDRFGSGIVRVPDLFLVTTPQLDLVAVPFGHEQPRRRAAHLDHRVVGGGGAVHDNVEGTTEVGWRQAAALGELRETVHDAYGLVIDRGRGLVEHDLAVGRHADEVGEGATDVDPYSKPHYWSRSLAGGMPAGAPPGTLGCSCELTPLPPVAP